MNQASASEIADQLLHDLAPIDPAAADALGMEAANVMPALAPADFAARHEAYLRAHRSLDALGTPTPAELVLGAALRERVDAQLALDDAGFTTAQLAPLATPMHQVREVFDNLPHQSPADWERVAEHLARVPSTIAAYAKTLRAAANAGHVAAARQVLAVAAQCERWIGTDDFYRRLVAPCDPRWRDRLDAGAAAASESTARFVEFLRGELLPRAPKTDGAGRDLYTVTSRAFLGENVDLEDTYAFGWEELAQLTAEMHQVAAELGHDSIEAAAAALDADPARRLSTPDELTGWLQSRVDDVTNAVDGVHFDLPTVARRAECRISPTASGVMYYSPPDPSFSRPGRPAQALAFRVGAQLWRQARGAAERRPGFDLRAFHMHALRLGPLGLGPLREVMS